MNENEIMNLMNTIEYGWVDRFNKKRYEIEDDFSDGYILQTPTETMENKVGVCWCQVELERFYFENTAFNAKTYFLVFYGNKKCPTHTFLVYEKDLRFYWFEHSWEKHRGIHEYDSLAKLLFDVKQKFIADELGNRCGKKNLVLYEYGKPKSHISVQEFYNHCENGTLVK